MVWSAQLVASLGRQVVLVALPFQLWEATHSPLSLSLLALVNLVPLVVLSLGAGALADAVDQRRLMIATQAGLAVTAAGLAMTAVPAPSLPAIYLVALAGAVVAAIDAPARKSALYRTVARERMAKAAALEQTAMQAASVCGPTLGGVLIAAVGLRPAYIVVAVGLTAGLAVLARLRPIPALAGAARPTLAAIAEGFAFTRQVPIILATFVIDLDAMIFGLPVALFPILATDVFHAGPAGLGLLTSAPAAGALVGVLVSGWAGRVRASGRAVVIAVLAWGVAICLFGLVTSWLALGLVFLAVAGAADVFSAVFRGTIVQLSVPDALRGRVSAMHVLVVSGGPRLGDVEATLVAAATSATFSVVSGGLLCIAGAAWVAWRFPQLLGYRAGAPTATAARAARPGEAR